MCRLCHLLISLINFVTLEYISELHGLPFVSCRGPCGLFQVLENIAKQCGLHLDSAPSSPQKIDAPEARKPNLVTMEITKFQDIIFYLSDTANTLAAFLDIYEKAAKSFLVGDFPIRYSVFQCFVLVSYISTQTHSYLSNYASIMRYMFNKPR